MDTMVTDGKLYSAYRSALKKQRHQRAGARKQAALHMTADRYHVPVSTVKKVAQAHDVSAGITHEHTEEYAKRLAYYLAAEARQAAYDANPVGCPNCGSHEEVKVRADPVDLEIYDVFTVTLACIDCYEQMEMEV